MAAAAAAVSKLLQDKHDRRCRNEDVWAGGRPMVNHIRTSQRRDMTEKNDEDQDEDESDIDLALVTYRIVSFALPWSTVKLLNSCPV